MTTGHKSGEHHGKGHATHEPPPDEIQRAFWQYRRVWIGIIILLVAARFALPHIPLLRGWEQKFSSSALEIGKLETPVEALRVTTTEAVNTDLKSKIAIPAEVAELVGPQLVAAWKCAPMGAEGACLRYVWNGEALTLVFSSVHPSRLKRENGPFTRTGWGGYFVVQKSFSVALVGPADPRDLLTVWPYAVKFANTTAQPTVNSAK